MLSEGCGSANQDTVQQYKKTSYFGDSYAAQYKNRKFFANLVNHKNNSGTATE